MRASKSATGSVKLILFSSPLIATRSPRHAGEPAVTYCKTSYWLLAFGCWLLFLSPQPYWPADDSAVTVRLKPRTKSQKPLSYQLDFETPGTSPFSASPRKHKRHRPNLRRYPRGRPQIEQRLRCWVENFGFFFVLAIFAVVAI